MALKKLMFTEHVVVRKDSVYFSSSDDKLSVMLVVLNSAGYSFASVLRHVLV
jgi:hypothetical protein